MKLLAAAGVALLVVTGAPLAAADDGGDVARGKALVARFECNRCHEGTGTPEAAVGAQCAGCHARILDGRLKAPHHGAQGLSLFVTTPSLADLGQTVQATWITGFLREPVYVRPHIPESMPRLPIGASEARDIAAYLTAGAKAVTAAVPGGGDVERGKNLAASKGCFACHEFTGAPRAEAAARLPDVPAEVLARGVAGAPDLRLARDRVRPDALVAWLVDPRSLRRDATMPSLGLSAQEAADVAAYVLLATLDPAPPPDRPPQRLPPLERHVTFEEVSSAVFRTSCVHCHEMGGPGDTGGFGFAARGIDVTTFAGWMRGGIGPAGARESLTSFTTSAADSRLVAALVARYEETQGRPVAGVRGMPLGLPPLTPEQLQLVETWVAQGAKER